MEVSADALHPFPRREDMEDDDVNDTLRDYCMHMHEPESNLEFLKELP